MTALEDDLRAIALAAVSEEGRTERWQSDETLNADLDELAAKRQQRNESDRYPTTEAFAAAALEDQQDRADSEGPF